MSVLNEKWCKNTCQFFSTSTNNKMPISDYDIIYKLKSCTGLPCKYNSVNGFVIVAITG